MKKLIALLTLLCLCFSLFACGNNGNNNNDNTNTNNSTDNNIDDNTNANEDNQSSNSNTSMKECTHNYQVIEQKKVCSSCGAEKVALTKDNISDYLIFTLECEVGEKIDERMGNESCSGKVTINVSPKKNITFDSLVLTIELQTSSEGWLTFENREIEVPFNGTISKTFNVMTFVQDYVSGNPHYKLVITNVTGWIDN